MSKDLPDREFTWAEVELLLHEFKRVARYALRQQRDPDLQTTDLMHTALRRMFQTDDGWDYQRIWVNRAHVLAWFRTTVQRTLKDHRRARSAQRRQASGKVVSLDDLLEPPGQTERDPELLHDLCQSIEQLAEADPDAARILALSLVLGLSNTEIAAFLGISDRHSRRELAAAIQKLQGLLKQDS